MAKRTSISPALAAAANTKDGGKVDDTTIITTGISIPTWALNLVSSVAHKRKLKRVPGVPTSVSAVLVELIEKSRAELEAEIQ